MPISWAQCDHWLKTGDGEEKGFTGAEFKQAQKEGWEKQYQYKVGRKKEYMAPSVAEAAGYERASKTPKSTRFGRQNPIAARWNSDEQLVLWRSAWADVTNQYLERIGAEVRIDHRSHADRGLLEQPTVHEGVAARAMERQGFLSDRCELNRQIKADNARLRELRKQVAKISQTVMDSIGPAQGKKGVAKLPCEITDFTGRGICFGWVSQRILCITAKKTILWRFVKE